MQSIEFPRRTTMKVTANVPLCEAPPVPGLAAEIAGTDPA